MESKHTSVPATDAEKSVASTSGGGNSLSGAKGLANLQAQADASPGVQRQKILQKTANRFSAAQMSQLPIQRVIDPDSPVGTQVVVSSAQSPHHGWKGLLKGKSWRGNLVSVELTDPENWRKRITTQMDPNDLSLVASSSGPPQALAKPAVHPSIRASSPKFESKIAPQQEEKEAEIPEWKKRHLEKVAKIKSEDERRYPGLTFKSFEPQGLCVLTDGTKLIREGDRYLNADGTSQANMTPYLGQNASQNSYHYLEGPGVELWTMAELLKRIGDRKRHDMDDKHQAGRHKSLEEAYKKGAVLDPIEVELHDGKYSLIGGNHRIELSKKLKFSHIPVRLV